MKFSEHITNLLLIIIAVGMTELIIGTARLLKEYDRIKFYLPAFNIIAFFFLYYLLAFFDSYFLLADIEHVKLMDLVMVGFPPLAAVYTSYFVFPTIPQEGIIDLRSNFYKFRTIGNSLGLAIIVFRIGRNVWYYDQSILLTKNWVEALLIPMSIAGFILHDDRNRNIGTSLLVLVMLVLIYVNSLYW